MEMIANDVYRFFIRVIQFTLLRARKIRALIIKAMILVEEGQSSTESLRWMFEIHNFVEDAIDRHCVAWGKGIHVKHQLMNGIHSFFYQKIPSGSYVLDIGCGIGAVAYSIVCHTDAHVIGIDKDEKNLTFARERFKHPNLEFILGDATKDIQAGRVDVVVLSSVIEHITSRIELLRTLIQKFQPKLFLIRVPTLERHYFVPLKRKLGLMPYSDPTHILEYSIDSFEMEMKQAGLDIKHKEIRWGDIWAECVPTRPLEVE